MSTSVSDNEPPNLAALTEWERQIVQLICKGLSNKEVAHLLNKEARARLIAHLAQAAATGAAIESGAFLMRFFEVAAVHSGRSYSITSSAATSSVAGTNYSRNDDANRRKLVIARQ